MNILFLYLKGFSFTGGIEKFNRSLLKALHELSVEGGIDADAFSAYDAVADERYFPRMRFRGYKGNKLGFAIGTIFRALRYNTVIIGHINVAAVACLIKLIKPSINLVLIAHGIEVWKQHTGFKRRLLEQADTILAVSNYTKEKIVEYNPTVEAPKIKIFPNTLDPYFKLPTSFDKPGYLLKRYNLRKEDPILLTVTRLSFSEKYKGYDITIELMNDLAANYKDIKYLICGRSDEHEKVRIDFLCLRYNAQNYVDLTGFIPDDELVDHYLLADVFVMPSKKEGFGIVFIEAMACGRKVIAGSKDGSVDALLGGALGKLVDPDSKEELKNSIVDFLENVDHNPLLLQQKVVDAFGFERYKERLQHYLLN